MRKVIIVMLTLFVTLVCTSQSQAGQVTYEYWLGIGGGTVQDLLNAQAYIDDLPSGSNNLFTLEGPRDWADNYGARVICYLIPPTTGDYKLYIASDDASQLYLSTDDSPENLIGPIAEVVTYCAESPPSWAEFPGVQDSAPIHLVGGNVYYMEAYIKEGGGGDNFAVGWEGPGIALGVIGGIYLADQNPSGAQNIIPAHRQGSGSTEDVLVSSILSWEAPIDPNVVDAVYDVYLGTEPNLPGMTKIADGISETSVDPGGLDFETRHYWRIVTIDLGQTDPNGNPLLLSSGQYKWFETELATPLITLQPTNQWLAPGETATFSIEASSTTEMSYSWRKTSDPDTSIGISSMLEIANAQVSDEDGFYCIISNAAGDAISETASLTIKRLLGQWKLDEGSGTDAVDSSGNGNNGTIVSGTWNGEGLDFDGLSTYIDVAVGGLTSLNTQVTVTLWTYGDAETQPRNDTAFYASDALGSRILNSHLPWSNSNVYWDAGENKAVAGGYDRINRGATAEQFEGQWNSWIFVKDAEQSLTAIYYNGSLWHSGGGTRTIAPISRLVIGCGIPGDGVGQDNYYDGMIKDFRIYNYAKSSLEAAEQYIEDVPDAVICLENPPGDNNGDCKVNLADLALTAGNWMACGRVPECLE